MEIPLCQFQWQDERAVSIPPDFILRILPEPDFPRGRKGLPLASLWATERNMGWPGLVVMDQDVVIDPDDLAAMNTAACADPGDIHVAPVKLWPASTQLPDWIWAHRGGTLGWPAATQDESTPIVYWTTNFTYMPSRLLSAASEILPRLTYVDIDVRLPEVALQLGIASHLVPAARPKHLHF